MRIPSSALLSLALVALLASACSESSTLDPDAGISFVPPDAYVPDGGPDAGPMDGDIGAVCTADADCEGGICLAEGEGFDGGYCSSVCTTDEDCPGSGVCLEAGGGTFLCFDRCDPAATERECRAGYGCASSFSLPAPICLPGCTDDTDCEGGLACDPEAGFSGEGRCHDPDASIGDACTSSTACPAGGFCLSERRNGFPGGVCVTFGCDLASDTGCPGDGHCLPGFRGGFCYDGCETDADCREAYTCAGTDDYPDRNICQPACTADSDCSGSRVCNPAVGYCDDPFDAADLGRACDMMRGACAGGTCLTEGDSGFPDSYCVYEGCDADAADDADGCPGIGVCAREADGSTICLDSCEADADCRADYACRPAEGDPSGPAACRPACATDAACTSGGTCDTATGRCT